VPTLKRRPAVMVAIAGAVLLAGGFAAAQLAGGGTKTRGVSYIGGSTQAVYYAPGHRATAPDFSGTTLTGTRLSFSSYHAGKVVVLNFWGSWCVPCREEAPMLAALSARYHNAGVVFLGIDEQDTPASARAFEASFGVGYPSVNDSGSQVTLDYSSVVPISGTPTTVVIDRSGRVGGAIFGSANYTELSTILNRLTGREAA
jgi:thiol-disulfide isomerase/thioredoxin